MGKVVCRPSPFYKRHENTSTLQSAIINDHSVSEMATTLCVHVCDAPGQLPEAAQKKRWGLLVISPYSKILVKEGK